MNLVSLDDQGQEETENILDLANPLVASTDQRLEMFYSLVTNEFSRLSPIDGPQELVFGMGGYEVKATLGADGQIIFDDLAHIDQLQSEDFLSIRMYTNNDTANILWEYEFGVLIDVAVDLNRDGKVEFGPFDEDAVSNNIITDKTYPDRPFRFWVNSSYDAVTNNGSIIEATSCDEFESDSASDDPFDPTPQTCEQWTLEGVETESNIYPLSNLRRIESRRDLEDFSPLAIKLSKSLPENSYLKFTSRGLQINLFKGVWRNDERVHAYIYDHEENVTQTDAANDEEGHLFKTGVVGQFINVDDIPKYFDHNGIGRFIFEGTAANDPGCEATPEQCYLLVEAYKRSSSPDQGITYVKLSEQKLYLDLRDIKSFYQNITAGEGASGIGFFGGDAFSAEDPGEVLPAIVDHNDHNFEIDIYEGVFPEAELKDDYTLLVHGWRMTDSEKLSFADTAFKRLYWSGYKGRFGSLSWPTGWFYKPAHEYSTPQILYRLAGNAQNYGKSESTAREVGVKLAEWLKNTRNSGQYGRIHAIAHSMGNVVVSEALLHAQDELLLDSYAASQAAEVAGGYDPTVGDISHRLRSAAYLDIEEDSWEEAVFNPCRNENPVGPDIAWRCYNLVTENLNYAMPPDRYRYTIPLLHGVTTSDKMALANVVNGKSYYADIRNRTRIVNFNNSRDVALNAWEFNQLTKPDFSGGSIWSYDPSVPDENSLVTAAYSKSAFGFRTDLEWHEGQPITKDKADILAHIIPARTNALGQVSLSLNNAPFPPVDYGTSNQGHSAQFYNTYANRQQYWRDILGESLQLFGTDLSMLH